MYIYYYNQAYSVNVLNKPVGIYNYISIMHIIYVYCL